MQMLTRLSVVEDLKVGTIMIVSYYAFQMHELDFGDALGRHIEAFRLPSKGLIPGLPVIFPKLPDGSCEFVMNESEEVVRLLEDDEIFMKFVKRLE